MTLEHKKLLLKDLCARLPYGVKCKYYDCCEGGYEEGTICGFERQEYVQIDGVCIHIEEVKPYLFPLSSMTEEQKKELFKFCEFYIQENGEGKNEEVYGIEIARRPDPAYCYDHTFRIWGIDMRAINWLLKNHFDINGLIPMELAIDATGLNIY